VFSCTNLRVQTDIGVQAHRLTPAIRRAFVKVLRTPALLAMFAKDPVSMSYAQAALRIMALLEPALIMPELLERAYGGLEVVNETHRTTAVLSMLSAVPLPLVSERVWVGGQKHLVPLLELCIPGIDLVSALPCMYSNVLKPDLDAERSYQDRLHDHVHCSCHPAHQNR
jgi:hypothetical protein